MAWWNEIIQGLSSDSSVSCAGDTTNVDQTTFVWMKNVVEMLEESGAPLEHVYFTQG